MEQVGTMSPSNSCRVLKHAVIFYVAVSVIPCYPVGWC